MRQAAYGALALILSFCVASFEAGAREKSPGPQRESPGNEKAWRERQPPSVTYDAFRSSAEAMATDLLPPPTTNVEIYGKNEALEDLWALAIEIQGMSELRRVSVPDIGVQKETEERAERAIQLDRKILGFILAEADGPLAVPMPIPNESYLERVERLTNVFRQLIDPTVILIAGDVLDIDRLDEVKSGFANLEALILSLSESDFFASTGIDP